MKNQINKIAMVFSFLVYSLFTFTSWSEDIPIPNFILTGKLLLFNDIWRAASVKVYGSYAFITDLPRSFGYNVTLHIIDFSYPSRPKKISKLILPNYLMGGEIDWPYYYYSTINGFNIVDMSNPANPKMIGEYHIEDEHTAGGVIQAHGKKAIFVPFSGYHAETIDLQDPIHPKRIGLTNLDLSVGNNLVSFVRYFIWDGSEYAYLQVIDNSDSPEPHRGLIILDVSKFDQPYAYPLYKIPPCENRLNVNFYDMIKINQFILLADYSCGLRIIDVSNPSKPILTDTLKIELIVTNVFYRMESYLFSRTYNGLCLFYLQDSSPILLHQYPSTLNIESFAVSGHYLAEIHQNKDQKQIWLNIYDIVLSSNISNYQFYK